MRNPTLWESTSLLLVLILPTSGDQDFVPTTENSLHDINQSPKKIFLIRAVENSRKFGCREPQPRAYNLQDLMQEIHQNSAETPTHPAYIILKRCDAHAGCCHTTELSCSPVTSSNYFEDMEIRIWNLDNNESRNMWIRIEQHGKCVCEETNISDRTTLENQRPHIQII